MKTLFSAAARPDDKYGQGHFGASRGNRRHVGIDFTPMVHALVDGKVTRIGYPYGDDLEYRYVEVTDSRGLRARYFYIQPCVQVHDTIKEGDPLGTLQDLGRRYPNISPHCHFEVKDKNNNHIDPENYLETAI